MKKPSEDVEQDYFDWEMAVTISDDMRKEIEKLESIKSEYMIPPKHSS